MATQRVYHGWIIVENAGRDLRDYIFVEWHEGNEPGRRRQHVGYGESGCASAVEWWDKKLHDNVKLQPALRGSYRVYTEEKVSLAKGAANAESGN